jgi:DNA-binding MarR family transcriptional regulator
MMAMTTADADHVDEILREWRRAYPAVDASPIEITGRVTRIALYSERDDDQHLEPYGLTRSGFDVLAALRSSPAHRLSPTLLAREQRMSSAGITGLIDQLAAMGLVARSPEPHDRRRVVLALTRRGSEVLALAGSGWRGRAVRFERAVGLDSVRFLNDALGQLLATLEPGSNGSLDGTSRRLARLAHHINADAEMVFSKFGITHGSFQVLASLFRAGPPYRRSPSRVARGLMLSGAGLTGRMDQLERGGLLQRNRGLDDRRAVVVELTPAGRRLVRASFPEFMASHRRMLDRALAPDQQAAMSPLLRTVLKQFESSERLGPQR